MGYVVQVSVCCTQDVPTKGEGRCDGHLAAAGQEARASGLDSGARCSAVVRQQAAARLDRLLGRERQFWGRVQLRRRWRQRQLVGAAARSG